MSEAHFWVVRVPKGPEVIQKVKQEGVVAVGFAITQSVEDVVNRDDMKNLYRSARPEATEPRINVAVEHKGMNYPPILVWTSGYVQVQFGVLQTRPPFTDESKRLELLRRLNEVPGIAIPEDALNRYPNFRLSTLKEEGALRQFLGTLDWFVQEIRSS
jgi:hypothetical protein